jgi:hypothetical protein
VDRALARGENGVKSLPKLIAWEVTELPDSPLVRMRFDPVAMLTAGGLEPPPSASAYTDDVVDIDYFDENGAFQSYAGLESDFDWEDVRSAVRVDWPND